MASKGGWNDPDMLEIGTGLLSEDEEATHFALWAFSKAPLMISADLTKASSPALMMKNLIDINQDKLGNQATCSQGCGNTTSIYKALVSTGDEGLSMGVLGVNWDDFDNHTLTMDLVANDIAAKVTDNC